MDERAQIKPTLPRDNPTLSYWQDPPDRIADFRSGKQLPESADYVIVGGGITGACIAFNLLERQPHAKILMLEARGASSGASGRNGGHTKAASYRAFPEHAHAHGIPEAIKIAKLELANVRATHAFAAKHNIVCESRPCETVDIIYDADAYASGIASIKLIRESMPPNDPAAKYEILDAEKAKEIFLVDGDDVKGAFKYEAGSISAYKFVIGVLKLCLANPNFQLQTFTPVASISKLNDMGIWVAQTSRGAVTTKNLVLATNGYTAHLLPLMQTKIVPLRGQVTAHRAGPKIQSMHPDGLPTTYSFIYSIGYEYMISRPRLASVPDDLVGDVVIGGGLGMLPNEGLSEFGETDDTVLNNLNSGYLRETTKRYFGSNWGDDDPASRVRKEWTGIMGITGDGLPYVGPVPEEEGLWICAGFNGHGMVLCMKSAEALTHMLCGDKREVYDWFPESFVITKKRLKDTLFEGRKGMKAPLEFDGIDFKTAVLRGTTHCG
ncbi:uncharacterized protein PV09_07174 [Verruconis gallopava]|uniref:FAD dependent oxidoreductase domain-containing protein n=1 Tax=Verruconis gallopava TaxID=253628 RepID=A0A0D2A4L9_9PEZI|nr:uncharacterized protein PV09_07174 [Verruconis gallopava]KIW01410.1 hypothetical protein PV09_07174 [Verruconis gallopava]